MLMRGWNKERSFEFERSLANIGAKFANWVEAIQYSGEPRVLHLELSAKRSLFSRHHIAAGIDKGSLETMCSYIGHHPDYKEWKLHVTNCELVARSGDYMILERSGLKGGNREEVANIIRRFGGTQEDICYFLDKTEDNILGYVLPNAYLSAADLAEIVQIGRTTPITPAEQNELARKLARVLTTQAESRRMKAEEQQELVKNYLHFTQTHLTKTRDDILLEQIILKQLERGLSFTRIHELLEDCDNAESICEPLINLMEDSMIIEAFNDIASRRELTADEKAVTEFALFTLFEGYKPTSQGLSCLERVCDKELFKAILDKAT